MSSLLILALSQVFLVSGLIYIIHKDSKDIFNLRQELIKDQPNQVPGNLKD